MNKVPNGLVRPPSEVFWPKGACETPPEGWQTHKLSDRWELDVDRIGQANAGRLPRRPAPIAPCRRAPFSELTR